LDSIEKGKNGMLYNSSTAIIYKVNLTVAHVGCLQTGRLVVQSPVPPDQLLCCRVLTFNGFVKTQPKSSNHLLFVIIWLL